MCLAVPGKIVSISGDDPLLRAGKVDFGGILKEASLACVPEAQVGDYVIVHAGFAISRLEEAEANQVFGYLRQMEELGELEASGGGLSPASQGAGWPSSPPSVPPAAPASGTPAAATAALPAAP